MASTVVKNYIIVHCRDSNDVTRLFEFVNKNRDNYKFVRKYKRAITFNKDHDIIRNLDSMEDGRVFCCKDDRAEFLLRLMFDTKDYVI